jgi:hypothetical protein
VLGPRNCSRAAAEDGHAGKAGMASLVGAASGASGRMLCQLSYRGTVLGGREL